MKRLEKKSKKEKKLKKILNYQTLKKVCIFAGGIIILELIAIGIMYLRNEQKISYIDTINDAKLVDDYYLIAGSSNFHDSKFNKKETYRYTSSDGKFKNSKIIKEQAKLTKYDTDLNIIWEKTFNGDYDSTFYDAIKVSDGYIAVGSYIYEYDQIELEVRDGLIVKYSDKGNVEWFKNYQILGDTEFYKVIDVNDGFIAIGQSIYENMELGNHTTGGGIIVKYDYDGNIVWKNNYGGNKSGNFNDIVVVKDGYIVCGKDGANYGLIVKFDKQGQIKWHYSTLDIAITDSKGFNAMVLYDNKLYIASSINYSDEKNDKGEPIYKFKGCVYVYDLNGKCLKKYRSNDSERLTDLLVDKNGITSVGYITNEEEKEPIQIGTIVKLSLTGEEVISENYGGPNHAFLTTLIENKNNYLFFGHSNSFGNKKDFTPIIKNISKDSKTIFEMN